MKSTQTPQMTTTRRLIAFLRPTFLSLTLIALVGAAGVLALLVGLVVWWWRRRRKQTGG